MCWAHKKQSKKALNGKTFKASAFGNTGRPLRDFLLWVKTWVRKFSLIYSLEKSKHFELEKQRKYPEIM